MVTVKKTIFVISDLHLGGEYSPPQRGFRLCTHADVLVAFLEEITRNASSTEIELIINGDSVDFLAEKEASAPFWLPFAWPVGVAHRRLEDILSRDKEVFLALKRFVAAGHRLVLLLGNHDIELSLPPLRRTLQAVLGHPGAGSFEFLYDGEAYQVGDILIEHGNRYDPFNSVDYGELRRLRSSLSRNEAPASPQFKPPIGSVLVADVINPIKELYPFVDLLKPEAEVLVPVLLALEPSYESKIARALTKVASGTVKNLIPRVSTRGADIAARQRPTSGDMDVLLRRVLGKDHAQYVAAIPQLGGPGRGAPIASGIRDKVSSLARLLGKSGAHSNEERLGALLIALRRFHERTGLATGTESPTYLKPARTLLAHKSVSNVIFGHTHLARQVQVDEGKTYFNSGTWADILFLPDSIVTGNNSLISAGELSRFLANLTSGDYRAYSTHSPSFVRATQNAQGRTVDISLRTYRGRADEVWS